MTINFDELNEHEKVFVVHLGSVFETEPGLLRDILRAAKEYFQLSGQYLVYEYNPDTRHLRQLTTSDLDREVTSGVFILNPIMKGG